MTQVLYKKECHDCSTEAENDVLKEILKELRVVLNVPERADIVHHAEKIMRGRKK